MKITLALASATPSLKCLLCHLLVWARELGYVTYQAEAQFQASAKWGQQAMPWGQLWHVNKVLRQHWHPGFDGTLLNSSSLSSPHITVTDCNGLG